MRKQDKWRPNRMTLVLTAFVFLILFVSISMLMILMLFQARFWNNSYRFINPLVPFALISLILGTLLSALFSRWLVKPVRAFTDAAQRLAAGDFDVTLDIRNPYEFRGLSASFNQMARDLKSTGILRKDFVTNVSHEFKTPISVIKGYADLIEGGGASPEECRDYARVIQMECRRLLSMSSNILIITRLENQAKIEEPRVFSLDEQIRQVALALRPRWEGKSIQLELDLMDISVEGNEELLSQAWYNLLDNAIKFSYEGGKILLTAYRSEDFIIVTCADEGVGMDAATKERAFEQFYQGDASHAVQGNGLGLTLVRKILELHDGTIEIDERRDVGTSITARIPHAKRSG